jgi:hypothetical protein
MSPQFQLLIVQVLQFLRFFVVFNSLGRGQSPHLLACFYFRARCKGRLCFPLLNLMNYEDRFKLINFYHKKTMVGISVGIGFDGSVILISFGAVI